MKYIIYLSGLPSEQPIFVARLVQQKVTSFDELISKTTRRGIAITDTQLRAAVNELSYTIVDELNMGNIVETPLSHYRPTMCGSFESIEDTFDLERHIIKIRCTKGSSIKIDPEKMVFEKVKQTVVNPVIDHFLDYSTMEENTTITPGGAAEINGELLKIDESDPLQGLFLKQNGTTVKVQTLIRNLPSDVIFNIPKGLAAGQYQLELRNKTGKNDKELKTYAFNNLLTVK